VKTFSLTPTGFIRFAKTSHEAPLQSAEGAPGAIIEVLPSRT
jgi:hypothetical protein